MKIIGLMCVSLASTICHLALSLILLVTCSVIWCTVVTAALYTRRDRMLFVQNTAFCYYEPAQGQQAYSLRVNRKKTSYEA